MEKFSKDVIEPIASVEGLGLFWASIYTLRKSYVTCKTLLNDNYKLE